MKVFIAVALLCGVFVFLENPAEILAEFGPWLEYTERLGDNEEFNSCLALECNQPTCADDPEIPIPCPLICLPGYICQKGYVRQYKNGRCIPRIFCPRNGK